MLPLYRILAVFVFLFLGINLQSQICLPAPAGGDECISAPLMSCNLDGYVGTSGGYTPGPPPSGFCGLVENDQYFKFVADEEQIVIQIVPSNCTTAKGLQATLYETTDCVSLNQVSVCASFGFENTLNVVHAGTAVIGQEYYILIDGFEGDVCDFTINVLRGILPDVEAEADNAELCLGNQISLDGTASTQRTNVEYYWTTTNGNIVSGDNSMTPIIDAIGDYTLTVIDIVSCCIDDVTVSVTENMTSPTFNFDSSYDITCADLSATLDPNLANAADYDFMWTTTNGSIAMGTATNTASLVVDTPGTYNLEIEDRSTSCTYNTDVVVVADNTDPDITATSTNNLDCINTETTINAGSSVTNLLYSWEGPNSFTSTDASFTTMQAGTYSVTIEASNGCTNTASVNVSSTGNPDASIIKERDIDCLNLDTRLTGSSTTMGAIYAWSGPSGPLGANPEIVVTAGGTYTLVVSLPNGCSTTVTEIVDENKVLPNISAVSSNDIDCTVTTATLEGASTTMGATFEWTGPNGFTSSIAQPSVSEGGDYTLTVAAPNGCTDNVIVNVIQNAIPPISDAGQAQMLDCNAPTKTVGGMSTSTGAAYTYAWTSSNAPGVLGTMSTLQVGSAATYTLEVTNSNNNCSATSTVVVTEDFTDPIADAGGDAFLTCSMREVTLGGTSSTGTEFTYAWTDMSGTTISDQAEYTTTLIGEYTLTVTNTQNGCFSTDVIEVDEDPYDPVAAVLDPDDITCEFPTITLFSDGSSAGAGIEYAWYDNNNALVSSDANAQVSNPGSYELVVTDTNYGCSASIIVRVDESVTPPLGNAGIDMNLDCSTNEVTLEASVSGDLDDFTFQWFDTQGNPLASTVELTTSTAARYDLIITNKVTGCTRESFATVIDNNVYPDADAGLPSTITCTNLQVQVGGANSSTGSDIIHEWFNSSGNLVGNLPTIDVTIPGTYQLVVTNAGSSCSAESFVTVAVDQVDPQANTGTTTLITCSDPISVLNGAMSTASTSALTYEWTDPNGMLLSSTVSASATAAGEYTLTVTDTQNGCQNTATIMVEEDKELPEVMVTNPEIINCYNNFVEVNYTAVNGPITPVWQDVNGNVLSTEESYLATQIGTVVLQATSLSNGCVNTSSIDIIEDKVAPDATIAEPEVLNCIIKETQLIPTINNFSTNANYTWTNSAGQVLGQDANLTVSDMGTYTLEIQSVDNGCIAQFFSTVQEDIEDPIAIITNTESRIDCYQPAIDINATQSSGNAALAYQWINSSNQVISDQESFQLTEGGLISLQVTNVDNGCIATADVVIDEDLDAPSIDFNPVDKFTCLENEVTIESVVSGSNNSFVYTWTGPDNTGIVSGDTSPDVTVDTIGGYSLSVQDQLNGCESMAFIIVREDRDLPELAIQPVDELNCVTPEVTIDASASATGSDFEYSWTGPSILSGDSTQVIQVDSVGMYQLNILNTETGCESNMDIAISENTERPVGATLIMEDPTCYGERDGVLDVDNVIGGAAPYLYAINSETNFTEIATYNNLPSGDFKLIIQDSIGCEWDTLFQIIDPVEVTADLGVDQVIRLGESSELFVQTTGEVVSIAWLDNGVDGPIDKDYREIQPIKTTTYVVVVTNVEGCSGTDNVIVEVEDDKRVFIPNSFSPNGDGVNDFFTIFTDIAAFEVSNLQIFDRWGNQVFEKNNFMPNVPEIGWDGNWRGKKMQPGTYVYSAFIEFRNGNKTNFKGEINIVY